MSSQTLTQTIQIAQTIQIKNGSQIQVQSFSIEGPLLIEPKVFADERGFFTERYKDQYSKDLNLPIFIQDNFSRSLPGVIRGLHYQWDQPQGKLVSVLRGKVFDVAVDIRKKSPTFGQNLSVVLDGSKPQWFWIPPGFAHGFCVIDNEPTDLLYKVDQPYNPKGESGIMFDDPDLNIPWPVTQLATQPLLSPKDRILESFKQYSEQARF